MIKALIALVVLILVAVVVAVTLIVLEARPEEDRTDAAFVARR